MSENGPHHSLQWQLRERTLEVLYPHLEKAAASAAFDDREVNTELANIRNEIWCRLQAAGKEP